MANQVKKICQICEQQFRARRDAKTCSAACRKRLQRSLASGIVDSAKKLGDTATATVQNFVNTLMPQYVSLAPALAFADAEPAEALPDTSDNDAEPQAINRQHGVRAIDVNQAESEPVKLAATVVSSADSAARPFAKQLDYQISDDEPFMAGYTPGSVVTPMTAAASGPADTGKGASGSGAGGSSKSSLTQTLPEDADQEPDRRRRWLFRSVAFCILAILLLLIPGIIINFNGDSGNHKRLGQLGDLQQRQNQQQSDRSAALETKTNGLQMQIDALSARMNKLQGFGANFTNASNLNGGTLSNQRLSSDVTLQGNTFNGPSELVQLTANGLLPALNGSNLTAINATTLQGNGPSYYTNASNLSSGTVSNSRLPANVALLDANNVFSAPNIFNSSVAIQGSSGLTLGVPGSLGGSLFFADGSSNNQVILQGLAPGGSGNATVQIPSIAAGMTDMFCLMSLANCGTGGSAVTSLDGQTGALTLANSTGVAGTITINNAKADASTKGIATFNATNFTDNGSGVINTVQNIATGSSPTFNALTLSGGTLNGQTISSSANFTGTLAVATLGSAGSTAVCYNGSNQLATCSANPGGVTLQQAYNASTSPEIVLNSGVGGLAIQDAATPIGGNLFAVQSNGGGTNYLAVSASGVGIGAAPANGILTVGTNTTTASGGIYFGTDTNLYRSAASTLQTDSALVINSTSNPTNALTVSPTVSTGALNARAIFAHPTFTGSGDGAAAIGANAIFQPSANINNAYGFTNVANGSPGAGVNIATLNAGFNRIDTGSGGGTVTTANGLNIAPPTLGSTKPGTINGINVFNQGAAGVGTAIGIDVAAQSGATTDIGLRVAASSTYSLQLSGAGGTASSGIEFGTDTDLYRSGVGTLKTDGNLVVAGSSALTLGTASTNTGKVTFQGSGGAGTLTLAGPTTPNAGNFTLTIPAITGNANVCTDNSVCAGYAAASGSGNYIQNGTTTQIANFNIESAATNSVAAVIQGATGQTANLLNVIDGSGSPVTVLSVTKAGVTTIKTSTNNAAGFQVQGSANSVALDVDTTNTRVGIGTGTPTQALSLSTGTNIAQYVANIAAPSLTPSASGGSLASNTYFYKITALDAAGGESNITLSGEASTAVTGPTGSVQVSWTAATGAASYRIYRGTSAAGENVFYTSATNSFTDTGAAGTGGSGQNNVTAYVNKFTSGGNSWFDGGNVGIGTAVPSALLQVRTPTNTPTAFNVQNAAGTSALNVDTTNLTTTVQGGTDTATLGSNLVTCTDFTNVNAPCTGSQWTTTGWTAATTTATHNTGNTSALSTSEVVPVNGTVYEVSYTVNGAPAQGSTLTVTFGGVTVGSYTEATSGPTINETKIITAANGNALTFTPSSTFNGVVSAVSVQQLTTNPNPTLTVKNTSGTANIEVRASSSTTNTFIGLSSGQSNSSGTQDTALGTQALQSNTTGSNNSALGYHALLNNVGGSQNSGFGNGALASNTGGNNNTAVGSGALGANTVGNNSTAVGNSALNVNTTGVNNTALGGSALAGNTSGSNNVALGNNALQAITVNNNNVSIGSQSFISATGGGNVGVGFQAGRTNTFGNATTTGANNTFIGTNSGPGQGAYQVSNAGAIGFASTINQSNAIVFGCVNGVNNCTATTTVGIGSQYAPNALTVSPGTYGTNGTAGTASTIAQTTTAITGTSTTFTTAMTGGTIYYNDGTTATVTFVDATHLTSSVSKTVTAGSTYTIVYGGFNVTANGTAQLQPTVDSTTTFNVQNSLGTSLLAADTSNMQLNVGNVQSNGTLAIAGPDGGSVLIGAVANSATGANALTFSGNEITDATRATGTQGDGRQPPDSSTGIWEPTTNLLTNGGFESNTTGWAIQGAGTTITRDTTTAKFGSASLSVSLPNTNTFEGASYSITVTNALNYSWSAWVKAPAGKLMRIYAVDSTNATLGTTAFTATGTWQRQSITFTGSANNPATMRVARNDGNTQGAYSFNIDGAQLEQRAITTPYVETNGGTAARSAARVQAPAALLSQTQGWVAMRIRLDFPSTYTGNPMFWSWGDVAGNRYYLYWLSSQGKFDFGYTGDGGSTFHERQVAAAFNVGDTVTLIGTWGPSSTLGLSVNGAAFSSASSAGFALPTPTTPFNIGTNYDGTTPADSDILWTATGTGTLSNSDAANFNGFGNSDPSINGINTIDGAATPTFAWNAEAKAYSGTNNTPTLQSGITLDDASLYRGAANTLETNSYVLLQPTVDSTTAFQIQNAAGTGNVFDVDTVNKRVGIGTLTPGAKLDIQAVTNIGLNVNQTGASDILDLQQSGANVVQVTSTGATLFKNSANSTTAFQILDSGNTNLLTADTTTDTLTVDNLTVTGVCTGCGSVGTVSLQSAYTAGATISTTDNKSIAFTLADTTTDSSFTVNSACTPGSTCSAGGGKFQVQSAGTGVFTVAAGGAVTSQNSTNSSSAFLIQNAAGSNNTDNLFNLSTVYNANNKITNGSFEIDTTGWAATSNIVISQDATQGAPYGSSDLKIVSSGPPVALNGAKYTVNMTNNTVYSMSFYAKTAAAFATMTEGWSNDGTTNQTTGCSTTQTPSTTLWLRFTCTFTYTGTTNNGVSTIFIGQNDATARTWYVDGVSLEQLANGSLYKEGTLNLNGLALGNTLIQPAANSNAAFAVVNVAGVNGLLVDTNGSTLTTSFATTISSTATVSTTSTAALQVRNSTTAAPLIKADTSTINNSDTNGSFENSTTLTTGYAVNHAGVSQLMDLTAGNAYEGGNTDKISSTTSAVANTGVKYPLTTVTMASTTTYTLSFYVKLVAGQGAFTTLTAGHADDGAAETACVLNNTTVSGLWQRYTCTFTTGTTSGTPYFYIGQTDAGVAHQYYLDGIQFIGTNAAVANYHEGNIQLNGVITSPTIFQNNSDGQGVFQIQNASGNTALNVDTNTGTNNIVANSGFENGAGNWPAKNSANSTISTDSTAGNVYQGDQSLKSTVTGANAGMNTSAFTTTIGTGTQYQLTFFAKCDSTYNTLTYGRQDVTGTDVNSTTSATCNTNWQQYTAHWTTGGTITSPNIYVTLGATTAGTVWIDDVSLVQTNTSAATNYNVANISLGGILTSPTIFQNTSNSTMALQVQNAAGSTIFNVDTQNQRVGIGTNAPGNLLSIGALTTAAGTYQVAVSTGGTTSSGIVVQTVAGQSSGNILQAQDSTGAALATLDYLGNLTVKAATVNGALTVNGHIITGNTSGSTTASVNGNAGSGSSCSVSGNDTGGQITLTTGTSGWANGIQCTINFASSFGSAPHPVMSNATNVSTAAVGVYVNSATGNFTVNFMNAETAQHTYIWNYFNAQ